MRTVAVEDLRGHYRVQMRSPLVLLDDDLQTICVAGDTQDVPPVGAEVWFRSGRMLTERPRFNVTVICSELNVTISKVTIGSPRTCPKQQVAEITGWFRTCFEAGYRTFGLWDCDHGGAIHVTDAAVQGLDRFPKGTFLHLRDGKLHRDGAPAVILTDGAAEFWRHGEHVKTDAAGDGFAYGQEKTMAMRASQARFRAKIGTAQ